MTAHRERLAIWMLHNGAEELVAGDTGALPRSEALHFFDSDTDEAGLHGGAAKR